MAAPKGTFAPELVPEGWFAPELEVSGWFARDFIDEAATGGTDSLSATGIVSGTPTVGSPPIGQTHVLTAAGIATGAPSVGSPAVGQVHVLSAVSIACDVPTVGSPALVEPALIIPSRRFAAPPPREAPERWRDDEDKEALRASVEAAFVTVMGDTPAPITPEVVAEVREEVRLDGLYATLAEIEALLSEYGRLKAEQDLEEENEAIATLFLLAA